MVEKKNIFIGFIIACFFMSPLAIAPASATDWPMFQQDLNHSAYLDEASDFNPDAWLFQTKGKLTSPVISDKILYFGSSSGLFNALNLDDGSKVWNYQAGGNITGSPVIAGDDVYFGSGDSYLYALNKKTGDELWKYKTGNAVENSPAVDNGVIYFGSDDQRLYALNTTNGTMNWEFQTTNAIKSSPTISNGSVFFGSDDGNIYSVNINNGSQNWAYNTGNAVETSPAINNTTMYMGTTNGNFYALNTGNGTILWTYNLNDTIKSSAVLDPNDNTVFVGSDSGNFTALDMRDGTLKWSVNTGNVESTAALMGDNIVVTSNTGTVYVLNKYSGKEVWSYMPGYYLFNSPLTSPIVYGDDILAGDNNGNMYAMDFSRKVGAPSMYLYYVAAIVIVIFAGLIALRVLMGRRRKKGE